MNRVAVIATTIAVGYFLLGVGFTLAFFVNPLWALPVLTAATIIAASGAAALGLREKGGISGG